jgi:hypothetical protein
LPHHVTARSTGARRLGRHYLIDLWLALPIVPLGPVQRGAGDAIICHIEQMLVMTGWLEQVWK